MAFTTTCLGLPVFVPETLTDVEIDRLIAEKRGWIYKNLAEWQDINATRNERDYVNGEGFLYLGRSYRIKIVEHQQMPLVLKNGYFYLRTDGRMKDAQTAFKEFYREKGKARIPQRVSYYQDKMGIKSASVRIIDLKTRWTSCSRSGTINFHWKCMMAPMTVIDYIVVHELAHLLFSNHSDEFWNEIDKQLPDYQESKAWLRKNGAGMEI